MRTDDDAASTRESRDPDWPAQHPALDAALAAAIRGPVVDARFDRQVWARIGIESSSAREPRPYRSVGPPFWLETLNALAIATAVATVAFALSSAAQPISSSARAVLTLVEQSPRSIGIAVLVSSVLGLWLAVRQTPFGRAVVPQWL